MLVRAFFFSFYGVLLAIPPLKEHSAPELTKSTAEAADLLLCGTSATYRSIHFGSHKVFHIVQLPDVQAQFEKLGVRSNLMTIEQFKRFHSEEYAKYSDIGKRTGIHLEE